MRKTVFLLPLLVLMCAVIVLDANGQSFNRRKKYNTLSVHLNAMNYFGDLVPNTGYTSLRLGATRPNLGVSYAHRLSPRISVRGALMFGRITGDDKLAANKNDKDAAYRYYRNLSFRNDLIEVSGQGVIDLFENRGTYLKRRDFSPYFFGGLAIFYHNPKAQIDGKWVALQPLGTEGQNVSGKGYPTKYSRVQISLPFGAGVNYKLDRQYNLGFEIGWRKTFTDYLDDVSTKYPDFNELDPGQVKLDANGHVDYAATTSLAAKLSDRSRDPVTGNAAVVDTKYGRSYIVGQQRGTNNENDWYIVTGFHFSYIIIPALKSPKFR